MDKGVVEVTNCFCVPHIEHDDQVEAELSYGLDVYDLNRRVNPSETIVGKCEKCKFNVIYICHVFVIVLFNAHNFHFFCWFSVGNPAYVL